MRIKATALKGRDLRDRCGRLELHPDGDDEADLLSRMYRLMAFGGVIEIRRNGQDRFVTEFPGPEAA